MRRLFFMLLISMLQPAVAVPVLPETVPVGHHRELRGAWVASVANMHFPSRPGLTALEGQREIDALVARAAECRLNAIFFQVRPEGDALYSSKLEPWSRFLTGTQGGDPGYDPLAYLIEKAHAQNIEVHAWLNPYRASAVPSEKTKPIAPHIAAITPAEVVPYGSFVWMLPTSPAVQKRLVDVCRDLVQRYDFDGLHFDDYFYPYPEGGQDFPDQAGWQLYQEGGGPLSRADWRRANVNQAIAEVARTVHQVKPYVRFGISPFGLPAPQRPAGIAGFDQYAKLYADPQLWSDRGYVDYLAPQLYWPTTRKEQAFEPLLTWWTNHAQGGRYTFAGLNIQGLSTKPEWTLSEYREELELIRERSDFGAQGCIWWSIKPLLEDRESQTVAFFQKLYPSPALPPPISRYRELKVSPPRCHQQGGNIRLEQRDQTTLRHWAVYQRRGERWHLSTLHPATLSELSLPPGHYAITAITRFGTESLGQLLTVR